MEAHQSANIPNPPQAGADEGLTRDNLVEKIEEITGYKFKDPSLLQEAFTASTYNENCLSYKRLEFFGDSVLNLLITQELYFVYPDLDPGELTRLRAANVDNEKLARVSMKWNLHQYLRHNNPQLKRQIEEFSEAISEYPLHCAGLVDAPKALADIVESLIGAIFVDCNCSLDTTWQIVKNLLEPMVTTETIQTNPVTKLHEACQTNGSTVRFADHLWEERGEIEVYVNEICIGRGKYIPKKVVAVNRAADYAYKNMLQSQEGS